MKQTNLVFLFIMLMSMVGVKAYAYDIAVRNADGVVIYYNYINDGVDLEVTRESSYTSSYSGNVIIPEDVTYMSRVRKVTKIGSRAFYNCSNLTEVTFPNSITSIGSFAFGGCSYLTSLTLPNSLITLERGAFYESGLKSVILGNNIITIGEDAFYGCKEISSISIPNSVKSIGPYAFRNCKNLTNAIIGNGVETIGDFAFGGCKSMTSVVIGNSVKTISWGAFYECGIISLIIPNSVTTIGQAAFEHCRDMTSLVLSNNLVQIEDMAFQNCVNLTSVTIPNSVTKIGVKTFEGTNFTKVISQIAEPFVITGKSTEYRTFSLNTFNNTTLYVPEGTINKYKSTEGWKDFLFIEEGNGGNTSEPQKCDKPTIGYSNGKLSFNCSTEGATCQSTITDTDITSYSTNEVQLGVTYNISVYATKAGYENSDVATATLCWIDVEPKTEGIENSVAQVRANAVLIQTGDGRITVNGADDGTIIGVYNVNGLLRGSEVSRNGSAVISTNVQAGNIVIVKIGDKSVKVVIQ